MTISETSRSVGAEVKAKATALIPFLRELGEEIDALGKLPNDVVEALANAGVWKMVVPVEYGGFAPMSTRDVFEVITEVSKGNASAGWAVGLNMTSSMVYDFPEQAQREFFDLSHVGPFAGASIFNFSHAEGVARKVDGGYLVKGSWSFSSNIRNAAWLIGGTTVFDEEGKESDRINVIIPRSEVKIADDWHVWGMKGSGSNTAYLEEEVFAPQYRAVSVLELVRRSLERGFAAAGVDASPMTAVGSAVAGIALGGAYGALEVFMDKAKTRKPWAQPYDTIAEMPTTQVIVAKTRATISFCEAALERVTDWTDRAAAGDPELPRPDMDPYYETVFAVGMLRDTVAELQNIMGSSTALETDALGRFIRDIRIMSLHAVLRLEWWSETYGRKLFGLEPKAGGLATDPPRPAHKHVELPGG